jgi:hypothetical protein
MRQSETEIQREIVESLRLAGALVFRMNAGKGKTNQHLHPAGTPDLFVIARHGQTVWMEVKTPSGHIREAQREMHVELEQRGQRVVVVRSVERALMEVA